MGKPRCYEKDLSRCHAGANAELRCEKWVDGGFHPKFDETFCVV